MALWNRFSTLLFGGAIGAAARTAIEPQIEPARQTAWSANQNRILELGPLAELVAEGLLDKGIAHSIAGRNGYKPANLDAMVELTLAAPGIADLMTARRRGDLTATEFSDGLGKLRIHPEFRSALGKLLDEKLDPADIANAIQQGFIPGQGILPDDPGGKPPYTPATDEVPIKPLEEIKSSGLDQDRLTILAQLAGLPPGPMELLDLWNRGAITEAAVNHGIREGHTKTKWTSALKELRHFLLSPQDIAGLRLRGWIDKKKAEELGALRGASPDVMEYLYLNRGRPATVRQVHIGYARGAAHGTPPDTEIEAARTAVAQSDIRPEWFNLLWAARYTTPSPFVTRALTQAGTFTQKQAETILLHSGWAPEYAAAAATSWAPTGATTTGPWLKRARSRLYTVAHNEYLDGSITAAQAHTALAEAGVPTAEADAVIATWDHENAIARLELTPAQLKKAYKRGLMSLGAVTAELEARGMHPADVDVFLNE